MYVRHILKQVLTVVIICHATSCQSDKKSDKEVVYDQDKTKEISSLLVPEFKSDSAYFFIEKQLSYGPRVPETKRHAACADWIKE